MNKSPLSELLDLAQQREDTERNIVRKVAHARAEGASWQAIANVIGGTKQAAQQRYSKQIEPLQTQGRYDCSCGWTIVYPGWEASEAMDDIAAHQDEHILEDERDDYGTEPWAPEEPELNEDAVTAAQFDVTQHLTTKQLAAETSINVDAAAPAKQQRSPELGHAQLQSSLNHAAFLPATDADYFERGIRLIAPRLDLRDTATMARIKKGDVDTAGRWIDWSGIGHPGPCAFCGEKKHSKGKGDRKTFWFYPGCNPTTQETVEGNHTMQELIEEAERHDAKRKAAQAG